MLFLAVVQGRKSLPATILAALVVVVVTAVAASGASASAAAPKPLLNAHAHNDYEHEHPLFDALSHGFCSVEADIFLIDGKLLVAHKRSDVRPEKTLQALYLEPLSARVKKNGGRVYPGGPECTLLIDLKSDWHRLYPALKPVLMRYSDMLTTFPGDETKTNAVRVIITGNRSLEMFNGEKIRYAAFDGNLSNLDSSEPASLVPWVSSNWHERFTWNGRGDFPPDQKSKLISLLKKAHEKHRRVRFWGGPDQPNYWREMLRDGVDIINTDDLPGFDRFSRTGDLD